jgi:hypothetical protein
MRRPLLGRIRLVAFALAGAVCGHTVAYVVSFPDRIARQSALRVTGHAYWHAAVAAAVLAAVWVALSHVGDHMTATRRRRTAPAMSLSRLALMQVVLFVGMEVSERLSAHAPLATLLDRRVLVIGVAVQLVTAFVLALALGLLIRAGVSLARAANRLEVVASDRCVEVALAVVSPVRLLAVAPCGSRGPPLSS